MRGHIYLLVGPSGGGKTTLIRQVTQGSDPAFAFIPSTTSRAPRPGETAKVDYHFVDEEEFSARLAAGEFLEWQRVHGYRYGSSRDRLEAAVRTGQRGITSADILGAFKIQAAMPTDVTTVFVSPTQLETLRGRICGRAPTSAAELERRLARVEMEMQLAHACDELVLNDDLARACADLEAVARDEERSQARRRHFGRRPVIRVVEVQSPPRPGCGTRFCVSECETPRQAAERVLHQWWWECHPAAIRFQLPRSILRPAGTCVEQTAEATLEICRWDAMFPEAPLDSPPSSQGG